MNNVLDFLKEHKYLMVALVLVGISIVLSITYSNYIVTSNNHKAAEMYIGELKYSIEIDETTTNTLSVPTGETIIDVKVNNQNPVDTYYKLLYLKNSNLTVKYYETTKDTDEVVTTYSKPNDSIAGSNSNNIKLLITNNSTSSQNVAFTMKGGYITNTIQDITTPSTYSEITLVETPSTNTYFCKTNDVLKQGLKYVNGQYTYAYKQEGGYTKNSNLVWQNNSNNGWGVQLTNKSSTDAATSKLCTYISNKPTISLAYLYLNSQATSVDVGGFNTKNIINMNGVFYKSQATNINNLNVFDTSNVVNMERLFYKSNAKNLDVSSFNTSKVTNMSYMFYNFTNLKTIYVSNKFNTDKVTSSTNMFSGCTNLVGGAGTKYNSSYVDKKYARIDGGTSNPGYFTDIADKPSEPNSFATDSWKTIINAVKNNNIGKYNVGDTKTINMGTYGTHTLRLANKSTPSECSGTGFSQTACGFVLEFADLITTHPMNDSATNTGGWPATTMRTFVNDSIYNALPSDLRNSIINTTVVSGIGSSDSSGSATCFKSTDKLYLLAPREIYNNYDGTYDTANSLTRTLDYYITQGVTTTNYSGAIKRGENISYNQWWWLRNANSQLNYSFSMVYDNGSFINNFGANQSIGVSPAFRIG